MTALLLPLGYDPAFSNVRKPKNPLSPFWTAIVANDDFWLTLDSFIEIPGLNMDVDLEEVVRQAAKMRHDAAVAKETKTATSARWRRRCRARISPGRRPRSRYGRSSGSS